MRKLYYLFLFAVLLVSCKNDDDPAPAAPEDKTSKIAHAWTCGSINGGACGVFSITLNSNGTGTITPGGAMTWSFTNSQNGFQVTVPSIPAVYDYNITKLTDNEFDFIQVSNSTTIECSR